MPRTPQHNAWAERAIGELKEQARAERTPREVGVLACWQARLDRARGRLNENRLRASRGFRSAEQLDKLGNPGRLEMLRRSFYTSTCEASERAVQGAQGARARRFAGRQAIFDTMEQFGLITQTRGDARVQAVLCERIA